MMRGCKFLFWTVVVYTAIAAFLEIGDMASHSPVWGSWVADNLGAAMMPVPPGLAEVYLILLGGFSAARTIKRFKEWKHDDPAVIAEMQRATNVVTREFAIVLFWLALYAAAVTSYCFGYLEELPQTLTYLTINAIITLVSGHVGNSVFRSQTLDKGKTRRAGHIRQKQKDTPRRSVPDDPAGL